MAKQKAVAADSLFGEIFQVGLYKSTQGRVTRQVTLATLMVIFAISAWRLYAYLYWLERLQWLQWLVPLATLLVGCWVSFRVINYPRFADFLIAVEAEMNKVSWPSRSELIRSSTVVIFVIFALAMILFGYDLAWRALFKEVLGILQ